MNNSVVMKLAHSGASANETGVTPGLVGKTRKYKIIALMGEAGSGKDTLLNEILKRNKAFHGIVSCTTRPPREGEVDGKSYFFLTKEEFAEKILNMDMLEAVSFRDWFYGTSKDSLDKDSINIGVFNPDGVDALLESDEIDLTVYYIRVCEKTRLIRQLNRETNPDIDEIFRRYLADKEDFSELNFDYHNINNETKEDLEDCIKTIIENL